MSNELVNRAATIAMNAASTELRRRKILDPDIDKLVIALRTRTKVQFPIALANAKKSLGLAMSEKADANFRASFRIVGREAVQDVYNN